MLFTKEVGIDLGTANTLIYVKGEGIVLNEPSVVSLDAETKKCLAVGQDAKEMLGRTPGRVSAIRPLKDGVIADFEVTELMLEHFIRKLKLKGMFSRPTILICCPSNITSVERNAIRDAAYRCGAKRVYIEEEPKVAAIGAGLDIAKPTGSMVLDIGGGTTGISILKDGEVVYIADEPTGGTHFSLVIAGAYGKSFQEAEVFKRDESHHKELAPVIKPVVDKVSSIISNHIKGHQVDEISLVGGTCCFTGIEDMIEKKTGVYTHKPHNPMFVTPLGIALSCKQEEM